MHGDATSDGASGNQPVTVWLRSTESTMIDAAALAERGEPHGTVVVAEAQTGGIGRHGHRWHSDDSGGLYVSVILRLTLAPRDLPLLTMALGLGVLEAVQGFCDVPADIRWPNDILIGGRKLAGILVQTPAVRVQIAGIGININQTDFPESLRDLATSLRIVTGLEQVKQRLLDDIVAACLQQADRLAAGGREEVLRQFERCSSCVRGMEVEVAGPRPIRGVSDGLDADGFLRVRTTNGVETVLTGGVRQARSSVT